MAHRLAARYRDRGEPLEDLRQIAALGLTKAVERYDPARGSAFPSYALPTIVGEIRRHFRDYSWDVHVPRRVQELRTQVRQASREMDTGDGKQASVGQLAARTGLSEKQVLDGLEAIGLYRSLSLDVPRDAASPDGATLADALGRTEGGYETVERRESVRGCLSRLPERERRVLHMRFFREMTQAQIADRLDLSQMHVSRLLTRTFDQLRQEMEQPEIPSRAPAPANRAA